MHHAISEASCDLLLDENYDKMQTIQEPDDSRSYTSPTPSSDDIQEGTLTKGGGGQEGSHFKKRKPMKTTSRGSMRKLMDNMMEHDQEDRQVSNGGAIGYLPVNFFIDLISFQCL